MSTPTTKALWIHTLICLVFRVTKIFRCPDGKFRWYDPPPPAWIICLTEPELEISNVCAILGFLRGSDIKLFKAEKPIELQRAKTCPLRSLIQTRTDVVAPLVNASPRRLITTFYGSILSERSVHKLVTVALLKFFVIQRCRRASFSFGKIKKSAMKMIDHYFFKRHVALMRLKMLPFLLRQRDFFQLISFGISCKAAMYTHIISII